VILIFGIIFAFIGLIYFLMIILAPYNTIRLVTVEADRVELHSLLSSWRIRRAEIKTARIDWDEVTRRSGPATDVHFTIKTADGRRFDCVFHGFEKNDPRQAQYEQFLNILKADLLDRK
jgi:hypothetical protein